jgi:hypothetical protein
MKNFHPKIFLPSQVLCTASGMAFPASGMAFPTSGTIAFQTRQAQIAPIKPKGVSCAYFPFFAF